MSCIAGVENTFPTNYDHTLTDMHRRTSSPSRCFTH